MRAKQRIRVNEDPRIATRTREIRAQLKESLEVLDGRSPGFPRLAAELAQRLIVIGARQRIFLLNTYDDLEQVERAVLLGMTEAALLTALDCGMSQREFVAWLRRTAINVQDGFFPTTTEHS